MTARSISAAADPSRDVSFETMIVGLLTKQILPGATVLGFSRSGDFINRELLEGRSEVYSIKKLSWEDVETFIKKTMSYNSELSVQLLLDCSTIPEVIVMSQTFGDIILEDMLKFSRTWCYTMDRERRKMLGKKK